ncbi:MAG: hypothetical protein HRT47_01530 [Candidatus Caenarcaniphilales bacterium]|nr:hypothetical protein [Candidatus Caenarcaniphilales bacterium]
MIKRLLKDGLKNLESLKKEIPKPLGIINFNIFSKSENDSMLFKLAKKSSVTIYDGRYSWFKDSGGDQERLLYRFSKEISVGFGKLGQCSVTVNFNCTVPYHRGNRYRGIENDYQRMRLEAEEARERREYNCYSSLRPNWFHMYSDMYSPRRFSTEFDGIYESYEHNLRSHLLEAEVVDAIAKKHQFYSELITRRNPVTALMIANKKSRREPTDINDISVEIAQAQFILGNRHSPFATTLPLSCIADIDYCNIRGDIQYLIDL